MIGWLSRALGRERADDAAPLATSQFGPRKLEAIASYADFCRTGQSPAYPLEIFLEISNICDLKCAMCVEFSALNVHRLEQIKNRSRGFMDQGVISENLENALGHALLVHCFGYGEPTIHPTFRSFLDQVSRYEVLIDFFTNGMHLDEEFCQFLVDRRIYKITVSFSGATKETYESIYLGGDFEKVLGGIKCLAAAKKARGSRYPIIEINSLAFRDHVARFDDFVTLMADHGANVVMLKPLQSYGTIPELFEHVSIMRPWIEGKIVERAVTIGRLRDVDVNHALYTQRGTTNEQEYDRRFAALKADADEAFAGTERGFGDNPVSRFEEVAAGLKPVRNPDQDRRAQRVLSLDSLEPVTRNLLDVRPLPDEGNAFHCMEPFKTLYIARNGGTKPCCYANPHGWQLGDAKADDALAVWRGTGFEVIRSAIAKGEYPMRSCEACIHNKNGPRGHFASRLLEDFLAWHRQYFGETLRDRLFAESPDASRLLRRSPQSIMRRTAKASAASFARPEVAVWPYASKVEKADEFVASRTFYLHRDFVPRDDRALKQPPTPGLSAEVLQLLHTCAQHHYSGKGFIVALGLPPSSLESVVAGLMENERIDAILAGLKGRDAVVETFGLAGGDNDIRALPGVIGEHVRDITNVRWHESKPIEICMVHTRGVAGASRRALPRLAPFFIPGQTVVVLDEFYLQNDVQWKVSMGLLSESFEWAGQIGHAAVFRYLKPLRAEAAEVSALTLPGDLGLLFHRHWHHERLPRSVRFGLELSYGLLMARMFGPERALAHLDALEAQYLDLLGQNTRERHRHQKLVVKFREKYSTMSSGQARTDIANATP